MVLAAYLEAARRLEDLISRMGRPDADVVALCGEAADLLEALPEIDDGAFDEAGAERIAEMERAFVRRKGPFSRLTGFMGRLEPELRRRIGRQVNRIRTQLRPRLRVREEVAPARATLDVTAPGAPPAVGRRHPVSALVEEVCDAMRQLDFDYVEGPEVEDEWHNFVALNIPENHPARDESDNFYITDETLLRSQTSPVQIRYMEKNPPPVRIFAPGRVFRPDTVDASHYYMFHQVEGLWVDEGVTFAHLKTTLYLFARLMLGGNVRLRLRPSFFPFTEPSAEFDFSCFVCGGDGCSTCRQKGWLEMGGCGMVDPNVLRHCGIDSERYGGFAFGLGIDRIVMARYGIDDIRHLFTNDVRFLSQF